MRTVALESPIPDAAGAAQRWSKLCEMTLAGPRLHPSTSSIECLPLPRVCSLSLVVLGAWRCDVAGTLGNCRLLSARLAYLDPTSNLQKSLLPVVN